MSIFHGSLRVMHRAGANDDHYAVILSADQVRTNIKNEKEYFEHSRVTLQSHLSVEYPVQVQASLGYRLSVVGLEREFFENTNWRYQCIDGTDPSIIQSVRRMRSIQRRSRQPTLQTWGLAKLRSCFGWSLLFHL